MHGKTAPYTTPTAPYTQSTLQHTRSTCNEIELDWPSPLDPHHAMQTRTHVPTCICASTHAHKNKAHCVRHILSGTSCQAHRVRQVVTGSNPQPSCQRGTHAAVCARASRGRLFTSNKPPTKPRQLPKQAYRPCGRKTSLIHSCICW